MRALTWLFIVKIAGTLLLWCLPLLLLPAPAFAALGMPAPEPLLFARLLGGAYLALLAGYATGIAAIGRGDAPRGQLTTAVASNGIAFLVLAAHGVQGAWSGWGAGAQAFMWLSTGGALLLAAAFGWYRARLPAA